MDDEFKKLKYLELYRKISIIRDMLNDLGNNYNILCESLKETISINNDIPNVKDLSDLKKNTIGIMTEINEILLPKISKNL